MSQPLRTAILGCGNFAHRHARTLQLLKDEFEMVAFCNRTIDKAAAFSEQYTNSTASVFADHHQMFDQVALDVVVICLPPYAHSDEVEIAAKLGVHVFIENDLQGFFRFFIENAECLSSVIKRNYMRDNWLEIDKRIRL